MTLGSEPNIHHRSESVSGFADTRILFRRIIENADFGPGSRLFAGLGLIIPSGSMVEENPFLLGNNEEDHTHFSMSEGVWKGIGEFQFFYRSHFPVLIGSVYRYEFSLKENAFGFRAGQKNTLDLLAYWQNKTILGSVPYGSISMIHKGIDFWEGEKAPNSGGLIIQPGFGFNWHRANYLFTAGIMMPGFYNVALAGEDLEQVNSHTKPWTLIFSFRKVFTHE
ncbi:MAG: hypothetical protein ISR82_05275 [Candidatus Marinimicrobia bacterium]|nr:hypothetical protein [Candidatus Neomarinimicrobiota bacterium]MBL7010612.1 hypothetical protein [Candidatus Neomarinimicrobiota bacterium]MBL7030097.1 hypothetical protein [Candidatus Neomarinimicrobiota bacterium]